MKEKILKFVGQYKWFFAALIIVSVFISLAHIKSGWYVDEIYSYGHASSTEGPFLNGQTKNMLVADKYNLHHRWISGEAFHDYLTVQKNERFHYNHIFDNVRMDVHPPLYFIILHTLRSFLPEGFGKEVGLALNAGILLLLLWWFYQLAMIVLQDKNWAFGATFFFAFLPIVLEMSLFIRMYLLETAFFVGLLVQTLPLLEDDKISLKRAIKIFCLAILCYLTHFYGLIYAFFLSAGMCIYFLIEKKTRLLFLYMLTMFLSVVAVALIYPAFFKVLLLSDRGTESFEAFHICSWQLIGAFFEQMIEEISHALFFVRDWAWVVLFGLIFLLLKVEISIRGRILLFVSLTSMFLLTIVAPNMGAFNGRYYVSAMAALYIVIICATRKFVKKHFKYGAIVISLIAVILAGINIAVMQHSPYLGRASDIATVENMVKDKKILFQRQYTKSIFDFAPAFKNADAVYIMFKNDNVDEVLLSPEFKPGSLLIYEVGIGAKKYRSKAIWEKNPELGLRYVGQYSIDMMCYDVYTKI